MKIQEFNPSQKLNKNIKINSTYIHFEQFLSELEKKDLPDAEVVFINNAIQELNSSPLSERRLIKQISEKQSSILKLIEKELKIAPKNHYRNLWIALGVAFFGLPIGVVLGLSLGNMGYIGMGLPVGLALGSAIGSARDKKTFKEGRQLDFKK